MKIALIIIILIVIGMLAGGGLILFNILKNKDEINTIIEGNNDVVENKNSQSENTEKNKNNDIDYEILSDFSNGFASVKKDGKYGYIDTDGNVVIDCKYDYAKEKFIGKVTRVAIDGNDYTFYNNGSEIIELDYNIKELDYALVSDDTLFKDGMSIVRKDGKYGYINENMEIIIECQYDRAYDFSEELAVVEKDDKTYVIDKTGEIVINLNDAAYAGSNFSEGLLPVCYKEKHFFINKSGKVVSKAYDVVYSVRDGMAVVNEGKNYGYIDNTGKLVIDLIYECGTESFYNGYAIAEKNKKYGLIDKTGKVIIDFKYDHLSRSGSLYYAGNSYIDKDENVYKSVATGNNGWTTASRNGKSGCLDEKGNIVIDFEYNSLGTFYDGVAWARKDGKFGILDEKGQFKAIDLEIESCSAHQSDGFLAVKIGGKWGFLDVKTAELVIEPQFEYSAEFHDGRARVQKNGKKAYIDKEGQVVIGNLDD